MGGVESRTPCFDRHGFRAGVANRALEPLQCLFDGGTGLVRQFRRRNIIAGELFANTPFMGQADASGDLDAPHADRHQRSNASGV